MKLITLCKRPHVDPPKRFSLPSGQGLRQLEQERAGLQVTGIYLPHERFPLFTSKFGDHRKTPSSFLPRCFSL
jgi:hypothetical protein